MFKHCFHDKTNKLIKEIDFGRIWRLTKKVIERNGPKVTDTYSLDYCDINLSKRCRIK